MKRIIWLIALVAPFAVNAQGVYPSVTPTDYCWKYVGEAPFTVPNSYSTVMAFNPADGKPWVAFADHTSNKVTDKKFNIHVHGYPSGIYYFRLKTKNSAYSGKFCKY